MKMLKLTGVIIASMFVVNSFGQTETAVPKKEASHQEAIDHERMSPEEKARMQTERLNKHLTLTSEQQAKIYETNLAVNMKNDVIHKSTDMTKEQKSEALDGNNEGRKNLIKSYLTDEQIVKFDELEAKKIERKEMKVEERQEVNAVEVEMPKDKKKSTKKK